MILDQVVSFYINLCKCKGLDNYNFLFCVSPFLCFSFMRTKILNNYRCPKKEFGVLLNVVTVVVSHVSLVLLKWASTWSRYGPCLSLTGRSSVRFFVRSQSLTSPPVRVNFVVSNTFTLDWRKWPLPSLRSTLLVPGLTGVVLVTPLRKLVETLIPGHCCITANLIKVSRHKRGGKNGGASTKRFKKNKRIYAPWFVLCNILSDTI